MERAYVMSLKITAIYIVVGATWILFSDELVAHLVNDVSTMKIISIYKGWLFVAATGLMLYLLVKRHMFMLISSEAAVSERNRELAATGEELRCQMREQQRTESELQAANQRLQTLFHASPVAIIVLDPVGCVTQWNKAAETLFGWTAEEVMGVPYPLIPEESQAELEHFLEKTLGGEVLHDIQVRRKKKNGELLHVSLSTAPIDDGQGAVVGIMVLLVDNTERKQAEEALRASKQLYVELVDSIDGIVWEMDFSSFYFTFVSKRAEKLLGYPVEEWSKTNTFWQDHICPEDRGVALTSCLTATERGENHELVYRFLTADGRYIWLRDIVTVVTENDRAAKLRGVMFDITTGKEAEEALVASEERYRRLFESNPIPMWLFDLETLAFLAVNDAAVEHYGYSRDEFLAMTIGDIRPEEDIPSLMHELQQVSSGFRLAGVWRHRKRDGSLIKVEIASHTTPFAGRAAVIAMAMDVTERLQAEEQVRRLNAELEQRVVQRTAQLEEANKELESFSYSVSHDLRAPLRHIDGFSQVLLEDYGGQLDEQGRNHLLRLKKASQRMSQLIDDLLELSRVSRSELDRQATNLSRLAGMILLELKQNQPERQVTWQIMDNIMATGDPRLLRVVLENLLGNAWKYTAKKGEAAIEFGSYPEGGETVYYVRDNGAGFDMRYADKLFAPFQRLHRAEEFEGTGIGLATVKRIVARHGGRIWAESAPDAGATFHFTLSEVGA
jgi:PAS domain S-box-containing protein